ncbi:hypothetical protein L0244_33010, partial [bacterium]|nr:hypothetical protein [bacterium]
MNAIDKINCPFKMFFRLLQEFVDSISFNALRAFGVLPTYTKRSSLECQAHKSFNALRAFGVLPTESQALQKEIDRLVSMHFVLLGSCRPVIW